MLIITQDEAAILYHIRDTLGFGAVRFDKGVQSYRYVVSDYKSIVKLVHIFNGNLFLTHRINQLAKCIKALQANLIDITHNIKPVNITLNDA